MCRGGGGGGGGGKIPKGGAQGGRDPLGFGLGGGARSLGDLARGGKITGGEIPGTPGHPKSYQNRNFSP